MLWGSASDELDLFDTASESFTVYKRDANRPTERYDKTTT